MHLLRPTSTRSRLLSCSAGAVLALGSLALIGCGDNMGRPADAAPPDASQQPSDARPTDAAASDAGTTDAAASDAGTTDGGGIDATPSDAAPLDAHVSNMCGTYSDDLEPNDTPAMAQAVYHDSTGHWVIRACLAGSNEDWYRLPHVACDPEGSEKCVEDVLLLRFRAKNSGLCAHIEGCPGPRLPDGPEHTVTLEVYRASTMELLATGTSEFGLVHLSSNAQLVEDLLLRVVGPAEALYDYRIIIFPRYLLEHECEC